MKATMAKRKIQQVLRHQFLTNKILSHWTAPFQVFSSTIIFLFTFNFSRPKTTFHHWISHFELFGSVQNKLDVSKIVLNLYKDKAYSAAMGEMRGVGVKNREKSADVLCGRPLMPCPSIGSKLFWTRPNWVGQT